MEMPPFGTTLVDRLRVQPANRLLARDIDPGERIFYPRVALSAAEGVTIEATPARVAKPRNDECSSMYRQMPAFDVSFRRPVKDSRMSR